MRQVLLYSFKIFFILISISNCIQKETAKRDFLVFQLLPKTIPVNVNFTRNQSYNGCMISYTKESVSVTMCFNLPSENCNFTSINNLINDSDIIDRKDKVELHGLIYPECNSSVQSINNFYQNLHATYSYYIYHLYNSVPNQIESNYYKLLKIKNCELSAIPNSNKTFLTFDEFKQLDHWKFDLGLNVSSTETCLNTLGFSSQEKALVDSIRNKTKSIGVSCSHTEISGMQRCKW